MPLRSTVSKLAVVLGEDLPCYWSHSGHGGRQGSMTLGRTPRGASNQLCPTSVHGSWLIRHYRQGGRVDVLFATSVNATELDQHRYAWLPHRA